MKLNIIDYVTVDTDKLIPDIMKALKKTPFEWTKLPISGNPFELLFEAPVPGKRRDEKLLMKFYAHKMTYELYYIIDGIETCRVSDEDDDIGNFDDMPLIAWDNIDILCELGHLHVLASYRDGQIGLIDNGYPVGCEVDSPEGSRDWSEEEWRSWYNSNYDEFL